jgi:succinate dehydrogenase / fumarate reductase membrane anchor subunit
MSSSSIGPKRLVVGARYGLRDWLAQRVTAVVVGVYALVRFVRDRKSVV